jgi:hypothetical protein
VFYTPPGKNYTNLWKTIFDLTGTQFQVKACSDVYILLTEYLGIPTLNAYEIMIGGASNTRSAIIDKTTGKEVASASTPEILQCYSLRSFWIQWDSTKIVLGTGERIGADPILSFTGAELNPFGAMSFAMLSEGLWEFRYVWGK